MTTPRNHPAAAQVLGIGGGQVLAWGSSTYLPAVVARPVAEGLGIAPSLFFAAFSLSLVVMALVGPAIGRRIDRQGGRGVLCLSNLVLAAGLLALSQAQGTAGLFAAWCVLGLGMGLGLYDAAFAALVFEHGRPAHRLIVGVSLVGGLASTIGWPLSAWLVEAWGWRGCCLAWAAAHLVVGLPLHAWLVGVRRAPHEALPGGAAGSAEAPVRPPSDLWHLALFAACTAFVTSAMAVHLPGLLLATGSSFEQALFAGMLLGPAQVVARLLEYGASQRFALHPLHTARLATALHPLACALLAGSVLLPGLRPLAGALFSVLHGAGNGMITVARGVLPLALYGPLRYGAVTGRLAFFGRAMQALAPFVFALVLQAQGAGAALALSGGLSLAASWSLWRLRRTPPAEQR